MNIIIIGLGNFGGKLATELTALGHEVIGVDNSESKTQALKDKVTICICLDANDQTALANLPLQECNMAIVAIGENTEASIMVTAYLKQVGVRRIISRAINPLQRAVIQAIGVDRIISPEEESARRIARQLDFKGVENSIQVTENYSIVEVKMPEVQTGRTLESLHLDEEYHLQVVTVKKKAKAMSILKILVDDFEVVENPSPEMQVEEGDHLLLFGANKAIRKFLQTLR